MAKLLEGGQWELEEREIMGDRGTKNMSAVRRNTCSIEMCY